MRIRITFAKTEAMRYTGHLDLQRAWERTFRRARLPLAYSQGFHPQARLNLACALPLGFTSQCELLDAWLETSLQMNDILSALVRAAPPGIEITHLEEITERLPALQTQVTSAEFVVTLLDAFPDLADRLVELGESVPREMPSFRLGGKGTPFTDPRLFDARSYPPELFARPKEKRANREALGRWGAWVNALGAKEYGQPLFLASSADLAGSTNIAGFGAAFGDFKGYGWYERHGSAEGALLPQEITEFANSGIMTGLATVNLSANPQEEFRGFWGISSTYGSFSYLLYGMLRLYSQLAQDCDLKLGKVVFVAGHSGPETADDSRTHFGIFAPGVTQLFPKGQIINLHPWEFNEVPVLLAAALQRDVPVVALHLTRPPVEIPDREALGIPSHFEAARGAYVVLNADRERPEGGTVIVQGTSAMAAIVRLLPDLKALNVKVVCATSPQLFDAQPESYRMQVLSEAERLDSTVITTQARWLMHDWLYTKIGEEYALSSDWDDRWRTGGTLEDILEQAHLTPQHILDGVRRFVDERPRRLARLGSAGGPEPERRARTQEKHPS